MHVELMQHGVRAERLGKVFDLEKCHDKPAL
jgi:hypothetical protein